ncbi:MAG: ATP/GTP-binding protein [Coriobacteriia bacterium]|jgi:signal recognition particle receptor subunit beta|nr:ATP/GTP-binding protein [Coriobacteriia bacterium]
MQSVKVVVTGPFNAGKTTFIRSVSEIAVLSTEREVTDSDNSGETTVAMDFGRITISDDVVLYIFGTPGQERFSFMWETLSEGMLGFVVLVDATDRASIDDATAIIAFFRDMSAVPFVVAVNRAGDTPEELEMVRKRMGIDSSVEVVAVDARDKESAKGVLLALLYRILASME